MVLTDPIWISFHPWTLLCQRPQGSWTRGKPVSPCWQVNVLAIYTRSNHERTLSYPTAWLLVLTDWTWILFHTWIMLYQRPQGSSTPGKSALPHKHIQCSGHLHQIKPWIHTFWVHCSGTECWLTPSGHLYTHRRCSIKDQKAPQHLKNSFAIKASQCSGHWYWIKPWIEKVWSYCSGI